MIKQLTLKNFRKHTDTSINFTAGLNAIRGPSEAGKSTLIESILYSLYGSKALRTTLDETVTWGQPVNSLKVELTIACGDKVYVFSRSKGGATVFLEGKPWITGQTECSNFATELLGADAKTASLLLFATQEDLRGALADGPTAVNSLISKLADFDFIDRILERAAERLLTGSEAPFAERLERAQQQLAGLGEPPQPSGYDIAASAARALQQKKQAEIPPLQKQSADANEGLLAVRRNNDEHESIQAERARLQRQITEKGERVATLDTIIAAAPTATAIAAADAALAQARDIGRLAAAYKKVTGLPAYPEDFWDADKASFDAEVTDLRRRLEAAKARLAELDGQIRATTARKITNGKCPTCGSTKNSDEHVAEHNAAVEAELTKLAQQRPLPMATIQEIQSDLNALLAVEKSALPFVTASLELADHPNVSIDNKVYPPVVAWVGDAPDASTLAVALAVRDSLTRQQNATAKAEGERAGAMKDLEALGARTLELEQKLAATPLKDPTSWVQALEQAQAAVHQAITVLNELKDQADDLERKHTAEEQARNLLINQRATLTATIEQLQADIKSVAFNNALMKKLKGLKPLIGDALWNSVLASVSTFFSQIRDEASVVTKGTAGFQVNGHSIESLSGSTLDSLALATRVALSKTFLASTPWTVIDEPARGCDKDRTARMLGFLAGCGFNQILLATHDVVSESIADNVTALEEA